MFVFWSPTFSLRHYRSGHRNVPEEQLASAWEMLTNRGQAGVGQAAGMGKVDGNVEYCALEKAGKGEDTAAHALV